MHEDDVRLLQRPARARQAPRGEEAERDAEHAERDAALLFLRLERLGDVSCARQHEERDRRVLAGDGDDHERVEELVVAERVGDRIRPPPRRRRQRRSCRRRPPPTSSRVPGTPIRSTICGRTIRAIEPSATQVAGATHVGAAGQASFAAVATSAPPQTAARIGARQPGG